MPQTIMDRILARIRELGTGSVFTPKTFLDLASHQTARQTLARLTKEGVIRRIRHGVYEYPEFSPLLNTTASPDPDSIARAIARNHGWTIIPSGEAALNLLGLSTQVPSQWVYLSDGPNRKYPWEGGAVIFKHRTNKEITQLSPKTALVVQALKALGRSRVDPEIMAKVHNGLEAQDRAIAAREAQYVTAWIYETIKQLAPGKEGSDA